MGLIELRAKYNSLPFPPSPLGATRNQLAMGNLIIWMLVGVGWIFAGINKFSYAYASPWWMGFILDVTSW